MEENNNDIKFVAVNLSKITPDVPLVADLYVKIGEKYIKYKLEGDELDSQKYNLFLSKNVNEIYIDINQLQNFMDWMKAQKNKVIDEIVEEVGEEHRELVEAQEEIKEKIYETFADEELDSKKVDVLRANAESFVAEFSEGKIPKAILLGLMKHTQSLANHAANVAHFSVYMGMSLGHGHQFVLENLYMGGLLHDYGKIKIPPNVLENPNGALYSQAIQDHPKKGIALARKLDSIDKQVLMIIMQHHEQFNGKGYPKGMSGDEIYELAQIVSIANIFDNILVENSKKSKVEMYRQAIKYLNYDRGKMFNPEFIKVVIEALQLGYGNYVKEAS